jgi:hypothetical protein
MVLSGRGSGACSAVRWEDALGQYRCGAIVAPREVLEYALPKGAQWLAFVLTPVLTRMGSRWIAAGTGCDSQLEVQGNIESTTMTACETKVAIRDDPTHHD